MLDNDVEDFIVITGDPFPLSCRDAKLYFDITWKNSASKLIINCRDISRKGQTSQNTTKIISVTISEFQGIHNELSAIEPKISSYFPEDFSFKTVMIERPNPKWSGSFFSFQPASIVVEDKEFSEECVLNIQNYLRAVVELCGKDLLFNVLFKEDNATFYEDSEEFSMKVVQENIKKSRELCLELLNSHSKFENLQSLTEDLYREEDLSLERFQEVSYEGFFMAHSKINEEIESLIDKLQKALFERQSPGIGMRVVEESNVEIEELLKEYYCRQRISINLKLDLSKSLIQIYSSFLKEMLKDQEHYETVIFRDCAGERLKNLSFLYHTENENISHYKLLLHSAEEIIVTRKMELIQKWEEGQEMIKPSLRHEDYSLIQLKNLNNSDKYLEKLDDFHDYMNLAYKILLNYYEARRTNIVNQKQVLDDPVNVIPPTKLRTKPPSFRTLTKNSNNEADSYQSINISGLVDDSDSSEEFEDALDETNFESIMKLETEKHKLKEELQNELTKIANVKAELRNSQHQLKRQYEKLKNKVLHVVEESNYSLDFSSLHPEISMKNKKPRVVPGSYLSSEERKMESRKANERVRAYNMKLKNIPEEGMNTKKESSNKFKKLSESRQSRSSTQSQLPPAPPPPPPPPPPLVICPPPMKIFQSSQRDVKTKGSVNKETVVVGNMMDELKFRLSKRDNRFQGSDIESQLKAEKLKHNPSKNFNETLSSMVDCRRQHFSYNSLEDEDDYDE